MGKWLKLLQNGEAQKGGSDPIPHFVCFWLRTNPTIWGKNLEVENFKFPMSLATQSFWFGLGLLLIFEIQN